MTKYTAFRCPIDLLKKAKIKANQDRRSLSNYLVTIIEEDVKDDPTPAPSKKKPAKLAKTIKVVVKPAKPAKTAKAAKPAKAAKAAKKR